MSEAAILNMKENNFTRMMKLVDEVFATRNDPDQLQVDQEVLNKLEYIHPATLSEYNEGNGPGVWLLVVPTTTSLMNEFVSGKISEQELFDRTQPGMEYEALYLCSATALPEYRGKGIAKELCLDSIKRIRATHLIKALFVWPFTEQGDRLAEQVSKETKLPLFKRQPKNRFSS